MTKWTSKNGIWKIHKPAARWVVENLRTGFCDHPSIAGKAPAYDSTEQIPQYVKDAFEKLCTEA